MFKHSFKYYKSKNPPPALDQVLDFNKLDSCPTVREKLTVMETKGCPYKYGMIPPQLWNVYELVNHPGLIFIRNPFSSIGQRYWTVRCLKDYSKKPNKTNLDPFKLVPFDKEWWEYCQNNNNKLLIDKLRWVTLGYHHDWDTKEYNEDNKSEFPRDLANLTMYITDALGLSNFNAEAAIVNYYHMDSTLSGHADYSEHNLEAPLISLSFGQTAIFLLGGKTKEEAPTAMFLRSGDIVVMSKESRLCYHGVPKILQIDSRYWDYFNESDFVHREFKDVANICRDETLWKPFANYLDHSRINVNVRQVLKRGQKRLCNSEKELTSYMQSVVVRGVASI